MSALSLRGYILLNGGRLLASVAASGSAADVIPVIAATRANRVSDWLHFLEWADTLAAKLSPDEKAELDCLIDHLAQHGSLESCVGGNLSACQSATSI